MKIFNIISIIFILVASCLTTSTQAQQLMCGERTSFLSGLKENFNEV